jgi:hypothetical protein
MSNLKEEFYCTSSEVFQQKSMFIVYDIIMDNITLRFLFRQHNLTANNTAYTAEDDNLSLATVN